MKDLHTPLSHPGTAGIPEEPKKIALEDIKAVTTLLTSRMNQAAEKGILTGENFNIKQLSDVGEAKSELLALTETKSVISSDSSTEYKDRQFAKCNPDFLATLKVFEGRKIALLASWLTKIPSLAQDGSEIHFTLLNYNDKSITASTQSVTIWRVNLHGWKEAEFHSFLSKFRKNKNFTDLIIFNGIPDSSVDSDKVKHFLEQLYGFSLLAYQTLEQKSIETSSEDNSDFVEQFNEAAISVTYRNALIHQLTPPDILGDPWTQIINHLRILPNICEQTYQDEVYYLKPFNLDDLTYKQHCIMVNSYLDGLGLSFFSKFLAAVAKEYDENTVSGYQNITLVLNFPLSIKHVSQLVTYLDQRKQRPPFTRLVLYIYDTVEQYVPIINQLVEFPIDELHLVYTYEFNNSEDAHLKKILPSVNFPLILSERIYENGTIEHCSVELDVEDQSKIIKQFQQKNRTKIFKEPESQDEKKLDRSAASEESSKESKSNVFAEKIALKDLLLKIKSLESKSEAKKSKRGDEKVDDLKKRYITKEVNFMLQKRKDQQAVLNTTAELKIEAETQAISQTEIQTYSGPLISFEQFIQPPYSTIINSIAVGYDDGYDYFQTLKQELFANIPNAIKYLTPDAAMQIAKNFPAFLSLNVDIRKPNHGLPPGFRVRSKPETGEWLLYYNETLTADDQQDFYIPHRFHRYERPRAIYTAASCGLTEAVVADLVDDKALFETIFKATDQFRPEKITSMWVKYGDDRVKNFFKTLKECDLTHPGFATFLYQHYLIYFVQWDHFLEDDNFLNSIDSLHSYSDAKMRWLKRFLENTGFSRHNLNQTLQAFDDFWTKLEARYHQQSKDETKPLDDFPVEWSTPRGGNPVVYIYRLRCILQQTRNIAEQLTCLTNIRLNNYGPFHAVNYANYKIVSSEMQLTYDTAQWDKKSFNPTKKIYPNEIDDIYEIISARIACLNDAKAVKGKIYQSEREKFNDYFHLMYRFLARHDSGIKIKDFDKAYVKKHEKNTIQELLNDRWSGFRNDNALVLFCYLCIVTRDNYLTENSYKLYKSLYELGPIYTCEILAAWLLEAYKKNILNTFNDDDLIHLFHHINAMYSSEFDSLYQSESAATYVKKIFDQCVINKIAVQKMLQELAKIPQIGNGRWFFTFALDTAEFLREDKTIYQKYSSDLLLFGYLINDGWPNVYYAGTTEFNVNIKTAHSKVKNEYLPKIKHYLSAAASGKNFNIALAFNIMLGARQWLSWKIVTAVFDRINQLTTDDPERVQQILEEYHINTTAGLVDLQDHPATKQFLSQCIEQLKQIIQDDLRESPYIRQFMEYLAPELKDEKSDTEQKKKQTLSLRTPFIEEGSDKDEKPETVKEKDVLQLQEEFCKLLNLSPVLKLFWGKNKHKFLYSFVENYITSEFNLLLAQSTSVWSIPQHRYDIKAVCDIFINLTTQIVKSIELPDIKTTNLINKCIDRIVKTLSAIFKEQHRLNIDFKIFADADINHLNLDRLEAILNLLQQIPDLQPDVVKLALNLLVEFKSEDEFLSYIHLLEKLSLNFVSLENIEKISDLFKNSIRKSPINFDTILNFLIRLYQNHPKDPLLHFLLNQRDPLPIYNIVQLTGDIEDAERGIVSKFLLAIFEQFPDAREQAQFFSHFSGTLDAKGAQNYKDHKQASTSAITNKELIEILSKSFTMMPFLSEINIDYGIFIRKLKSLSKAGIASLNEFLNHSPVNLQCLYDALLTYNSWQNTFSIFLADLEKSPFGTRNIQEQFDTSQVERVINDSKDMLHDSIYPYQYRKELMEYFLLINDVGFKLKFYNGKPVIELTNYEISQLFHDIKAKKLSALSIDPVIYALGLLREAMYRATKQFAYSTQMIAILDCVLHGNRVISAINTGQGKSLIDAMRAALLWLFSPRVDVTTFKLEDAQRDINRYTSFFLLLNIPFAKTAITGESEFREFSLDGINYSTLPHLFKFIIEHFVERNDLNLPEFVPNFTH